MYLIDDTYFVRELAIPTIEDMNSVASTELELFIDERCRFILREEILNPELFSDLDSNIDNGVLDVDAPQKWKDLVNGVTYTEDGIDYTWRGLLFAEGSFKGSLLAYYTYCFWYEAQVSYVSGVGDVQAKAKNANNVNPNQRLVNTWNTFVSMYQGNCEYPYGRFYYHDGVPVSDWFGSADRNVSLLQFLKHRESDYPDARMKRYEFKNQLGL